MYNLVITQTEEIVKQFETLEEARIYLKEQMKSCPEIMEITDLVPVDGDLHIADMVEKAMKKGG